MGPVFRDRDEGRLLRLARVLSLLLALTAAAVSFFMDSVGQVFRFLILIGNGPGLVLLLRWFWWRVNAWAEISAMLAGLGIALGTYLPALAGLTFGQRLALTAFGSMAVWLPVMLLTAPEKAETLDAFYQRIRPWGAWGPSRERTGLTPLDNWRRDLAGWMLWVVLILGGMLAVGWWALR